MSPRRFTYDDPGRLRWQNPESILKEIPLLPGMVFIDIGCGEGFFSVPAAGIVGPGGRVYACDVNAEAVSGLEAVAREKGLTNLSVRQGTAEETIFCSHCADVVFFGINLHDFADPATAIRNAGMMLKQEGVLADLDWDKKPTEHGPPVDIRIDRATAARLIENEGFRIRSVTDSGDSHYLIRAQPGR